MSEFEHMSDLRDRIESLESERDALKAQNSDISDSCMELVKERDALKADLKEQKWAAKVNADEHTQYQDFLIKDRDRWRGIAESEKKALQRISGYACTGQPMGTPGCWHECVEIAKEALSIFDEAKLK